MIPDALSRLPTNLMSSKEKSNDNTKQDIYEVIQTEQLAYLVSIVQVGEEWIC